MSKRIAAYAGLWIVGITLFAMLAWNRLNVRPDTAYGWIDPQHLHSASWDPRKLPARWDSEWYFSIAKDGYVYKDLRSMSNIVFFPVYPAAIFLLAPFFGGDAAFTGWMISAASLVAACVMLAKLVREFHPGIDDTEAVALMLLFPTAYFFNAVYTESIFLLLSVSAMYFGRRRRFAVAALFGAAAALTRVTGVLLFIPLVVEAYLAWKERKTTIASTLPLLAVPAACASFFLFHWIRYGDPTLFFKIQDVWGRSFSINKDHFLAATSAAQVHLGLDVFFAAAAIASVVVIWKRVRPSYAAYTLAGILVPISSGTLMSVGRYVLVLFPIHMAIATFPLPVRRAWMFFSTLLLALFATLYAHSYWAG